MRLVVVYACIDKVSHHVSQNHQGKVGRRLMFFQYVEHLIQQLFNVFVTIAGNLWHKSKSVCS